VTTERNSAAERLFLVAPTTVLLLVLVVAPIGLLLGYSFAPGGSTRADFSAGITLENYRDVLGDMFYLSIILKTIWISLIVTAGSILLGWPLAYFLWRVPRRWKSLLTVAVVAPLLISIPVRNYGWLIILGDTGLINVVLRKAGLIGAPLKLMFTDFAVVLGLTHVLMPFVTLAVLASLERVGEHLAEAAETLGASRLRAILHVVLPLSMPGVLGGAMLVFCVAVSAYVTPALMGPSGAQYATTLVYQQFVSTFDWPRGAAIAALLLLITLAALLTIIAGANRRYARLLREA
jgi:putative spermidine/putrescine transport system permease protein